MFKYSPQDPTFEVLTNFGKNKKLVAQFKAQSVATDAWSIICHRDFLNEVQFVDSLNGQLDAAINLTDSEYTIRQAAKHAYRKMILKGWDKPMLFECLYQIELEKIKEASAPAPAPAPAPVLPLDDMHAPLLGEDDSNAGDLIPDNYCILL